MDADHIIEGMAHPDLLDELAHTKVATLRFIIRQPLLKFLLIPVSGKPDFIGAHAHPIRFGRESRSITALFHT